MPYWAVAHLSHHESLMISHSTAEPIQGVVSASVVARTEQRLLAATMVIVPFVGTVGAVLLAVTGHAVGRCELALFAVMYLFSAIGIEVGFHRLFSHGAFVPVGWLRALLAIAGSMAAQGPVVFWVATHRRHHAFSDRAGDPHSPHMFGTKALSGLRGLWHAHVGWLFVAEITDWTRYAPDLVKNRTILKINQHYLFWLVLGLIAPAIVGALVHRTVMGFLLGLLWGGFVRIFVLHHMTWGVNSLCHVFGMRRLKTRDQSSDLAWLALGSLGGAWHNVHHAFPSLASNRLLWWQMDLSGSVISLFGLLGIARDIRYPTSKMRAAARAPSPR